MLPVEVAFVSYDPRAQTAIVFLRENAGGAAESPTDAVGGPDATTSDPVEETGERRLLPICIGLAEASAIYLKIEGKEIPRPMTHDLLASAIASLGASVRAVIVHTLADAVFHGRIELETESGQIDLDSRPSDAIALALRVDAPVFVEEAVMEESGILESDIREIKEAGGELRDFLEVLAEDSYVKV